MTSTKRRVAVVYADWTAIRRRTTSAGDALQLPAAHVGAPVTGVRSLTLPTIFLTEYAHL
ncbi:hypothetical protein EBN03_10450 [Nocardia stercoris]|uniref:Uncharacterized protein n=1 Tax=Nocardia stercoris TaxID=2483361 RepID=A0A3M2L7C3_9NOCA|nr:hypothetical protein EBN03_10450 [Nocardia stercoris]